MKLKELETQVKEELSEEKLEYAKELIQDKFKELKQAKKVYQTAEKEYNKLMEMELDDLEVEDFIY